MLVTLDTTRADHLGLYGYFRDTSPHLDAFAREALVFENHVVPMATTLPTHLSIFTGVYPTEHGVLANAKQGGQRSVLPETLLPFAQVAHDAGYETAAFVGATPLKAGTGIERGFETFDEPESSQRPASETTDRALEWLAATPPSAPFFLWVHYFDPHNPYEPPPPYDELFHTDDELEARLRERRAAHEVSFRRGRTWETRAAINGYDGEIRYMDAQLGRLFAALESRTGWPHTVVVVAGDHGESLGQHGWLGHGLVWGEQLQAPLLIRVPGEPARRIDRVVSSVDILPTVLSRVKVPGRRAWLAQASGRNAVDPGAPPGAATSHTSLRHDSQGYESQRTLTTDRWKYMRSTDGREALYDRRADPGELERVEDRHPGVLIDLRTRLAALEARQKARARALRAPRTAPFDPKIQRELRALGYLDDDG